MSEASKTGQVFFNRKGEPGKTGPLVYPAGEYSPTETYTRTELSTPVVLCDGEYYVLSKDGSVTGVNPKNDYAANGTKASWIRMQKFQYAFVEVLMANFAKLASAVFSGDYMFSQYGKDANGNITNEYKLFNPEVLGQGDCPFTPNLLINFLLGYMSVANRKILFNSDGSGYLANRNLYWDASGNIFFCGSIFNPMKSIKNVVDGEIVHLDFSTGFNIDISGACTSDEPCTILLPSASEYVGAKCTIWFGHICTRVPHCHPIISVDGFSRFINIQTSDNRSVYKITPRVVKIITFSAIPVYTDGQISEICWYIDNPNDVDIVQ